VQSSCKRELAAVGGVSDETVSMVTDSVQLGPLSDYTANGSSLVREGAPQKQDRKFQTATFRQEVISGRKPHKGARYQDILTD
jgi:hypothetical protein